MTRAALLAAALGCSACERQAVSPGAPAGLRVPLPEGWRAAAAPSGLSVGPAGRAALQLDSTARPFPAAGPFVAAIEAEGAVVLQKESTESFIGVLYTLSAHQAFLGVRQVGARTIWCSTTAGATADEATAAMSVCRGLSWEADAAR